jgi:predicted anti-sigma-YlaC factor YlaD
MSAEDVVRGSSELPAREKARTPRGEFEAFTQEDLALLYRRQARTALVTLAVAAIVAVIAIVVIGIVVAVGVIHENHVVNQLLHQLGR